MRPMYEKESKKIFTSLRECLTNMHQLMLFATPLAFPNKNLGVNKLNHYKKNTNKLMKKIHWLCGKPIFQIIIL